MTLFNNSKIKPASFKKAKFLFDTSNIKGGIKFAEFEYPKTDKRDIETLGKMLKKISVNCFIDCNKNYNQRDKLQQAFDNPKAGYLSLPFYKKFYGYVVEYSFNDAKNAVGNTSVSFEFVEVSKYGKNKKNGKGFLATLKSKILGKYEEQFDKGIETVKDKKEKFDSAVDTLKEVANKVNQVASAIGGAGDSLGDFSTSINEIVNSAINLVKSPKVLAQNVKTAFDNLSVAYTSSKDLFKVCRNLFDINEKDRNQIGNSQNSIDIRNNQDLINQLIKINALTLAYETSANINYSNTQELNQVIADLEFGFSQIGSISDRSIIDDLQALRYEAINYLNELALSVPNVVDYEVIASTPLTKILFNLYGNDDNKDIIISLNNINDTSSITGTIKVLKYEE
jgi:prophage DNA circulation protein